MITKKNRKIEQRKAVRDVNTGMNRGMNKFKNLLPCRTNFGTNDNNERLSDYKDNFVML